MMNFFTKQEIFDLAVSILVLTIIFFYLQMGSIEICLVVVMISFLSKVVVNKFIAKKFGCIAVYKIYLLGLISGVVLMFLSIPFTLIGWVDTYPYSYGRWGFKVVEISRMEMGLIAVGGILVNFGLAILFKMLSYKFPVFITFYKINVVLTFWNLLPIPKLDGGRIMTWSLLIWTFLFTISLFMMADVFLVLV